MKTDSRNPLLRRHLAANLLALAIITFGGGHASAAPAASGTWNGGSAADGNWSNVLNWVGGTSASGATTGTANTGIATFNAAIAHTWGLTGTSIVTTLNLNLAGISFDTAAGNYFIGTTAGNAIKLSSGGTIGILSTLTATNAIETINAPLAIQGAGGTYTFSNNSANGAGVGAGTLNIGGGITGGATGATVLTLGGSNTNANTISGIIANGTATTLAVTKSGAGTWVLGTNTNTFTGTVSVEEGTLSVSAITAALGSSSSVILGKSGTTGILKYTGAVGGTFAHAFALATGGTGEFQITGATADLNLSTGITGSGALTKTGAGTLTLAGNNTYAGTTTISDGTLSLARATLNTLPTAAAILVNGGTLDVAINNTVGAVTLSSGTISGAGTLTGSSYALTDSGTISAVLAGSGTLTKTGAGTVALNATNTFTGTVAVEEGTLNIVDSLTHTLGSASTVTLGKSGGTGTIYYTNTGGTAATRTFILATGGIGAFQVDLGTTLPISGVISGAGGLTKTGAGILNLRGPNTYSGDTTVSLGTLVAGNALAFQNSTLQYSAGTVQFATGITAYTLGGLAGNQALSLTNAGSAAIALTLGNNNADATYSGILSGALGSVLKTGTGTQILVGTNTYTGVTTLTGGTLSVATIGDGGVAGNLGQAAATASNLVFNGGTLQYTGTDAATNRNFTLTTATTGTIDVTTHALTMSGASTNTTGALTKTGAGTLILTGTNLYTGTTTVSAGTLVAGAAVPAAASGAFGNAASAIILGDAATASNYSSPALLIGGAFTVARGITIANQTTSGSYTLGGNTAASSTFAGAIALNQALTVTASTGGTVNLTKSISNASGTNTVTVTGAGSSNVVLNNATANQFAPTLFAVTSGKLSLGASSQIADATNLTVAGGEFAMSTYFDTVGTVTLASGTISGTGTLTGSSYALTGTGTVSAILGGSGALTKSNAGTATLANTNSYSGDTTIKAGTLALGSAGSIASTNIIVGDAGSSGAVLDVTAKTGGFTLSSGQTLKGIGTVVTGTGAAQTTNNGILAPGNSMGTLSITGDYSFGSTSTYQVELGAGANNADKLAISGAATIVSGAQISFTQLTTPDQGKYVLATATSGGLTSSAFTLSGSLPANYSLHYSATELDLQHKADQAFSSPTAAFDIITGGTHVVGAALTNSALSGSADLAVSLTNNSGTGGTVGSLSSSTGATVVVGTPGTISGTFTAGAAIGAGKTWSISNTDTNAMTSPVMTSGTVNVYNHASPVATPVTLELGDIHAGYVSAATSNSFTVANGTSGDYRVNLKGTAAAGTNSVSINDFTSLAANGGTDALKASLATGVTGGTVLNQSITYTYGDDSALSGANASLSTPALAVTGQVYSGAMIWNGGASGNFNDNSKWNDAANSAVHVAPGLDAGFTTGDSATFGNTAGSVTVNLNGAAPSLHAVTFNGTGSYTIAGTGTLTLAGTTPTLTTTSGTQEISAAIAGSNGLTKTGAGTLVLSNASNGYTGTTTISDGKLLVNGTNNGGGTVSVSSGGTLGGTGTIAGPVIVAGILAPGVTLGMLTTNALTMDDGSYFAYAMDSGVLGNDKGSLLVTGALTLNGHVNLTLSASAFTPNTTTLSLLQYTGTLLGTGGFFYGGNQVLEGTPFSDGNGNTWQISYAASTGGLNFATDIPGSKFITLNNLTAIPEPGSLLALGCLVGSGAFLRIRRRR